MIRSQSSDIPYRTSFSNGTFTGVADVPVGKGGAGQGFGPHELLEAALATCLTMTVQMAAAKHGYSAGSVSCEVRIDRTVPGTVTLNYALTFDGSVTPEREEQLRSAAAACPVARTLTGAIALRPVDSFSENA
jgi:putative redox protein